MTQKISVLIIEDEKSICDFVAKTLQSHDYKTMAVQNGKDGLAQLTSALPDIVLLDLGLPDVDGVKLLKELRTWTKVPVIVVSARSTEKDKIKQAARLFFKNIEIRTPSQTTK